MATKDKTEEKNENGNWAFPIIGIGASAGGLEALTAFFSNTPEESGMAFVVVTHTDPEKASMLPDILERKSNIPVVRIEDGIRPERGIAYVPPSDKDLLIKNGAFKLVERRKKNELHMPVDTFLRSLAEDRTGRAGCVILSGTGTDGTSGLRAIKENSGISVVQSSDSAQHSGMPDSAIETGLVDFVLSPEKMAEELIRYFKHPGAVETKKVQGEPEALEEILRFLADRLNQDFSLYKKSTLIRRIEHRMSITRTRSESEYIDYLKSNPEEAEVLFHDLLIGVTGFFRDPKAFEYLKTDVLPDLFARAGKTLRVWIPGCSTGEEAYSVAMVIKEFLAEKDQSRKFQIFATDIDKESIKKARHGAYVESVAADVSPERLARFFAKTDNLYEVNKDLRESVVFAVQNLLCDPPFSNLDLLVCRNLLIYLETEAQQMLIPLFHYTLKDEGVLFLGISESVGRFVELFKTMRKEFGFYRKQEVGSGDRPLVDLPLKACRFTASWKEYRSGKTSGREDASGIAQATESVLLSDFTPPCAIVNRQGQIIHTHKRVGKYLELSPGKPNLNITEMARKGLTASISSALRDANSSGEEIRKKRVRVEANGGFQEINLTVKPLNKPPDVKGTLMVVFEDIESLPGKTRKKAEEDGQEDSSNEYIFELEHELTRVREDYQRSMEELESSNEELKSSFEELQSGNEELESSREELESLNEELSTVNAELNEKNEELADAYNSIANVLNSTRIAILFLDDDLAVKRFTDEAAKLINLIDKDEGRPLEHLSHNLKYEKFGEKVREVFEAGADFEDEIQTKEGSWYRMRIMPFSFPKNDESGVVATFVNIDAQKEAQAEIGKLNADALRAERRFAENIVDTVRESLVVLDKDFKVVTANRRFYENFELSPEKTEGKIIFEVGEGQWNIEKLRNVLNEIIGEESKFEDFLVEHRFESLGVKRLLLNARLLRQDEHNDSKILLAIEDVTGKGTCEKKRRNKSE